MNPSMLWSSAVILMWAVSGCGSRDLKVADSEAFPPTFTSIRRRILEPRCVPCHSKLVAHHALLHDLVRPGNAGSSKLYDVVASGEMPNYGEKLKDPELHAIKTWIEKGAFND